MTDNEKLIAATLTAGIATHQALDANGAIDAYLYICEEIQRRESKAEKEKLVIANPPQ